MNKDEFTGYLEDASLLNAKSITSLNELISEFPYCQSARVLLTLNLFKEKNIRYDSELKTTAVYVSNRGLLRKYIDRLSVDEVKEVPSHKVAAVKEKPKHEEVVGKVDDIKQKSMTDVESPKQEVDTSDESTIDEAESIAEVKVILERHIRELELDNEKNIKSEVSSKSVKSTKQKSDIINDFIKNEPSISRPKTKFYNPVEKAKESIVDNENIVSETLAGIFFDQGHLRKAIKIYEKLSLKFPEKSSYFAALIKKAEKELES